MPRLNIEKTVAKLEREITHYLAFCDIQRPTFAHDEPQVEEQYPGWTYDETLQTWLRAA